MQKKRIKALIVDDSLYFRTMLSNQLMKYPNIHVVATTGSLEEAKVLIDQTRPDVVTLDVSMSNMDGLFFLQEQLREHWVPFIIISSRHKSVFEAIDLGAVDFVEKPASKAREKMDEFAKEVANKFLIAAKATPVSNSVKKVIVEERPISLAYNESKSVSTLGTILIGASTGGTEATSYILKHLPATVPGIIIVQHMPPVFTKMYADRLNRETKLQVKEAQEGDCVLPGHAYVAPGDTHIELVKKHQKVYITCNKSAKINGHRPSVDVLFNSASKFADETTTAIILTGMGQDGAQGMLSLRNKGAFTIGQDKESSVVYGMPMTAYQMGGVNKQVALENIPDVLLKHLLIKRI